MGDDDLIEIHPGHGIAHPLRGTYLAHDLRRTGATDGRPFIYGNFVVSLDGRIAVPTVDGGMTVPEATTNHRDWRLFQELAAQADLVISSGRYLRDWAEGNAQEILAVDDPDFEDLRDWRRQRGLADHPDIAIVSNSLDFPIPDVLTKAGRRVIVLTSAGADSGRVAQLEAAAGEVVVVGEGRVDGAGLARALHRRGYRTVYSAAGPRILHMLVAGGVLDRLYLTHVPRLLGGTLNPSIMEGGLLSSAHDMTLISAHLDPAALAGLGQLFLAYETTIP